MLCKWNKSLVYCRVPVFVVSQRSNVAQMIAKLVLDILQIQNKFPLTSSIIVCPLCYFKGVNSNRVNGWDVKSLVQITMFAPLVTLCSC